ncbi:MAG: carboxypeptidase regulatory-like domain-containing protein, partial [Gemmatimonadota bacterium]
MNANRAGARRLPIRTGFYSILPLLIVSLFSHGTLVAQTGSVTGTVLNAATGEPLGAAQLSLERASGEGTGLGTLSRSTGRFLIRSVPIGEYVLRTQLLGFGTEERTIQIEPGQTLVADFRLEPEAISLSEIVVTGVVGATQRTKLPFEVTQVRAADLPVSSVNPAQSLQGKVAGAQVVQGSGLPGSTPSVLLRGVTALDASGRSQDPLYIVDGVIL